MPYTQCSKQTDKEKSIDFVRLVDLLNRSGDFSDQQPIIEEHLKEVLRNEF